MTQVNDDKLIAAKLILTLQVVSFEGLFVKWSTTEQEWCFQNLCCSDCSLAPIWRESLSIWKFKWFIAHLWGVFYCSQQLKCQNQRSKKKEEGRSMPYLHFFHSFLSQVPWRKYQMFGVSLQPTQYWKVQQGKIYIHRCTANF